MRHWATLATPATMASHTVLAEAARSFAAIRTEGARLAEAGDMAAAERVITDATARSSRQALNRALDGAAGAAARDSAAIGAALAASTGHEAWLRSGLSTALVALALGLGLTAVRRGVVSPAARMAGALDAIAGGALDQPVPDIGRQDEFGRMARSADRLRTAMIEAATAASTAREAAEARARRGEARAAAAEAFETAARQALATLGTAAQGWRAPRPACRASRPRPAPPAMRWPARRSAPMAGFRRWPRRRRRWPPRCARSAARWRRRRPPPARPPRRRGPPTARCGPWPRVPGGSARWCG
ncbi:HAMP domain-containing protein [Siccirubricoccus deserti]